MSQTVRTAYCLSCGREFHPVTLDLLICPECGGETKADIPVPPDQPHTLPEPAESPPITGRTLVEHAAEQSSNEVKVPAEWQTGDNLLDTYTVSRLLGEGGMGKVYRVHHKAWNIDLAVKSPRPGIVEADKQKDLFRAEAETWVNLSLHPHIVTCYYVRSIDNIPRIFAELVEGGSLAEWIAQRKITTFEQALDIAIQFAWGLAYAHEQGLVHRDVKPANVLMTPDGTAKVTDFGLANAGKGLTPAYASPEQAEAQLIEGILTPQSDIWSWALSVLEIFAGRAFWIHPEMPDYAWGQLAPQALEYFIGGELEEKNIPDMPLKLAALMRSCFQTAPGERPRSMDAVAETLIDIFNAEIGKPYPRLKPKAADLRADSLNNRALSMLDLGKNEDACKCWLEALRIDPNHLNSLFNLNLIRWRLGELTDVEILKKINAALPKTGKNWLVYLFMVWVHLERGDAESARKIIESDLAVEINRPEVANALRNLQAMQPYSLRHALSLEKIEANITALSIHPDGTQAVSADEDKRVRLWDLSNGRCLWSREIQRTVNSLQFVSNSNLIFSAGDEIRFWRRENGSLAQPPLPSGGVAVLARDGSFFVAASGLELVMYSSDGKLIRRFPRLSAVINTVDVSSDTRWILSGGDDHILRLWNRESGICIKEFRGHRDEITAAVLSRDCRLAISADSAGALRLWDIQSGCSLKAFKGHTDWIYSLAIDPSTQYAITGSEDCTLRFWDLSSGQCFRTQKYETQVSAVCISEGGNLILSAADVACLWQLDYERCRRPAPLMISSISTSESAITHQSFVEKAILGAQDAFDKCDWARAATLIGQARSLPGFERDHRLISLWSKLYLHQPYTSLKKIWEVLSLKYDSETIVEGAYFDQNDEWLVIWGEVNEIWKLPEGEKIGKFLRIEDQDEYLAAQKNRPIPNAPGTGKIAAFPITANESLLKRLKIQNEDFPVKRIASSLNGKLILTGHIDPYYLALQGFYRPQLYSYLRLWDSNSGDCLGKLERNFTQFGFIRGGEYVLTTSSGLGQIWDSHQGSVVFEFSGLDEHEHSIDTDFDAEISEDCRYILTRHNDEPGNEIIKVIFLDWELESRETSQWQDDATPYLNSFLARHPSSDLDGSPTLGMAAWNDDDFNQLLHTLGCAGFGWLEPEGVRRKLEQMGSE